MNVERIVFASSILLGCPFYHFYLRSTNEIAGIIPPSAQNSNLDELRILKWSDGCEIHKTLLPA